MEIDITTMEACDLISLCKATGSLTGHKEKFDHIAKQIEKAMGIE